MRSFSSKFNGFTLIELLVVMSIIALLLAIAVPRYFGTVDRSKETILRQDLVLMRDAIDKYYGDHGKYPDALEDLVQEKYLRNIPKDPISESSESWVVVAPQNAAKGEVFDVKSGASGQSSDGTSYSDW